MDHNKNIQPLEAMRDIIKDFHDGTASRQEAEREYLKMLAVSRDNAAKSGFSGGPGHLKSLLAYHNINNFAKATALYRFTEKGPLPVESAGDEKILSLIPGFISVPGDNGADSGKNVISRTESTEYILATRTLSAGANGLVLACVSSSSYYTDSKFNFLAAMLSDLFAVVSSEEEPLCIDLQYETSMKIIKYFKGLQKTDGTEGIVYFFSRVNSIFGHLGIRTVKNVSQFVLEKLREKHQTADLIVPLNFKTYVCLIKGQPEVTRAKSVRIDFVYNGITLPYKTKIIPVEEKMPVYQFLDLVYAFENVIDGGQVKISAP